jgi:hypothetical protein
MQVADELIWKIVSGSQIPSEKKRQAVLRELRSHIEDSILAALEAGHSDDEILRLVLADFGDPRQIAQSFARVYRRERTMRRIAVFLLSTLVVASMLSAAILAMQAGVAIGFGGSALRVVASRHTLIEELDILSTVAAYVGFISIERLFDSHRFQKSMTLLTLLFAFAIAVCAAAGVHAPFLVFGLVSGVFLRTIQALMKSSLARTAVATACFVAVGFISFQAHPWGTQYAAALNCASWFVMGAGYQVMAGFVPRVDEALSNTLQRF